MPDTEKPFLNYLNSLFLKKHLQIDVRSFQGDPGHGPGRKTDFVMIFSRL